MAKLLIERARLLSRMSERKAAIADFTRGLPSASRNRMFFWNAPRFKWQTVNRGRVAGAGRGHQNCGPLVTLQLRAIDLGGFQNELQRRIDPAGQHHQPVRARKRTGSPGAGDILLQAGKTNDARVSYLSWRSPPQSLPQRLQEGRTSHRALRKTDTHAARVDELACGRKNCDGSISLNNFDSEESSPVRRRSQIVGACLHRRAAEGDAFISCATGRTISVNGAVRLSV